MPLASCLASLGIAAACSACSSCAGLFCFYSYFTVSACPLFWAFTASFIQCRYAGIVCLSYPTCDWSQLNDGIVCLVFQAYDWVTACWDSLSMLLHAGIVCLASLASDWVTECWDSLVAFSMLGYYV